MGDYSKILSMSCCVYFDDTLALLCETCLYLALLCYTARLIRMAQERRISGRETAAVWLPIRKFFMTF